MCEAKNNNITFKCERIKSKIIYARDPVGMYLPQPFEMKSSFGISTDATSLFNLKSFHSLCNFIEVTRIDDQFMEFSLAFCLRIGLKLMSGECVLASRMALMIRFAHCFFPLANRQAESAHSLNRLSIDRFQPI